MNHLKDILLKEFSNPFGSAKDLHKNRILRKQSYLAVFTLKDSAGDALVNILFEELIDPNTYDKFKAYSRQKIHQCFGILSSMGEGYTYKML